MIKRKLALATSLIMAGSLVLAGCGTASNTTNSSNTTTSAASTNATNTTNSTNTTGTSSSKGQSTASTQTASVALKPSALVAKNKASGTATLVLNTKTHQMTVTVKMTGLVANSIHPEHIHTGTVPHIGAIVYPLKNLVANKSGVATATTVIKNVKKIPAKGWVIDVHEGPNLKGSHALSIANGNVVLG
ncbi:CHRD domain-containing protein [Alicyclobacillus tolerans]|uniref:CHRD domain-containing protein n=1 Tax=Alicyclobacillus tolerans TaxID=90970 RepID=UPI001F3D8D4E|nr:CHRD domain-containing protein [Alicyclobacillus tolerans]MCF8566850.1 CHRD domain-containing protein [Alicyclobacillus tolerans]